MRESTTIWNANPDGCAPEQLDGDEDGVTDATDQCPDTPTGEPVINVGCGLSQIDSDNDGVTDDQDAFPDDPTEVTDSDGMEGDAADFYPKDAQAEAFRKVDSQCHSGLHWSSAS